MSLGLGLSLMLATPSPATSPTQYVWNIPKTVPEPIVPANNPMTPEKVELGRYLFYDKRLSVTGKFACASCHEQKFAFTDNRAVAIGATGERHPRNSMSLTNVAYNSVLTWANPVMTQLEAQALVPLFGEHPIEMGLGGRDEAVLATLRQDVNYQTRFATVFGTSRSTSPDKVINWQTITQAIAAFERNLTSFDSPFDRFRYGKDKTAISDSAKRGEKLFLSEDLECFHCHGGFNFSDSTLHRRSRLTEIAFHNTGLYNLDEKGSYPPNNIGIAEITHQPQDMGKFKAPTLRNIELTAPYMHDGSIATLEGVIDHYRMGGRVIHSGEYAGVGSTNPLKSQFVSGFEMTDSQQQDLIAFLKSLTDRSFIENPKLGDPWVQESGE